jgi:hypothetical protein
LAAANKQLAAANKQLAASQEREVDMALRLCHNAATTPTPPPPSTPTPSTPPPAQQPLQAQLMVIVQNEEDKRM